MTPRRWTAVIVLVAVALGLIALLVPLGGDLPVLTGGAEARRAGCASAMVDWAAGENPDHSINAPVPGSDDYICQSRATGRITVVAVCAAALGGLLVILDVRRSRRARRDRVDGVSRPAPGTISLPEAHDVTER